MLNGLDICAGGGIGSWAFEQAGIARTVCYVELDGYCQRVLQARMRDGDLAPAPIWDDLKSFDGRPWRGCVDFVFGGIPCQPYSLAGKRRGADDPRDLWPDLRRVLREVEPRLVFLEQVPGFLVHAGGFGRVLGDLAQDGYDAVWTVLSAAEVGAPHLRKRLWVLAYPHGASGFQHTPAGARRDVLESVYDVAHPSRREDHGRERRDVAGAAGSGRGEYAAVESSGEDVADADGGRFQQCDARKRAVSVSDSRCAELSYPEGPGLEGAVAAGDTRATGRLAESGPGGREADWWATEPDVGRGLDGLALGLECLRAIDIHTTGVYNGY